MKRGFDRTHRIADMIQKELAQMLLQSTGDERFRKVTVTGVTVARDLSHAKVYVSVLSVDDAEIKEIIKALNSATKMLRYHLAKAVKLRVVPELKFHFDDATETGFRISGLIDDAMKRSGDE